MSLNDLLKTAEKIANEFAHLKITTAVGDFKYEKTADGKGYDVAPGSNNSAIQTDINLIGREFTGESMAEIRKFHETQVINAQDIVEANINALVSLVKLVSSISSEDSAGVPSAPGADQPSD
jgi:hypothetical protein